MQILLIGAALALISAFLLREIAKNKGYDKTLAFFAGLFLTIFAIIFYWALDKKLKTK